MALRTASEPTATGSASGEPTRDTRTATRVGAQDRDRRGGPRGPERQTQVRERQHGPIRLAVRPHPRAARRGGHAPARAHAPFKVLLEKAMYFTGHRPPGRSTTCDNGLRERTRRRDAD